MLRRLPALLLATAACTSVEPSSCVSMCESATVLYGSCLDDWGVSWEAAGFADEDDFQAACDTWSWEATLLQDAAVQRGELADTGLLGETCAQRDAAMTDPEASCTAYTSIDWNTMPWEQR